MAGCRFEDMDGVKVEAHRIITEKILPAIRTKPNGPLALALLALAFALIDVVRAQDWPKEDLTTFVGQLFDEHARLDELIARSTVKKGST